MSAASGRRTLFLFHFHGILSRVRALHVVSGAHSLRLPHSVFYCICTAPHRVLADHDVVSGARSLRLLRALHLRAASGCRALFCFISVTSHRVLAAHDVVSGARSLWLLHFVFISFALHLIACLPLLMLSKVCVARLPHFAFRFICLASHRLPSRASRSV